jgi:hypothetical protein
MMEPLLVQLDNRGLICNDTGNELKRIIRSNMPEDCEKSPLSLASDILSIANKVLKSNHIYEIRINGKETVIFYKTLPMYVTIESILNTWRKHNGIQT